MHIASEVTLNTTGNDFKLWRLKEETFKIK